MAKKQIKVVEKSVEWGKSVIGLTDSEIKGYISYGFPIAYVYEMYPYGGGDDRIEMITFKQVLPDEYVQKRFANSKIRGQLMGDICMINLGVA